MEENKPTKAPRLNQSHKDFILLLACVSPHLTYEQMQALFLDKFGHGITYKQLKSLLKKLRPQIEDTKASEELTFELAKRVGLITLTEKVNRIMMLEEIARKALYGDPHEVQTARGTIVVVNKKDFSTSINAIKSIKEESASEAGTQSTYIVQIQDAIPPNHANYQSLESDEDL